MAAYWDPKRLRPTRRGFLGGAAVAGVGLSAVALTGCGNGQKAETKEQGAGRYKIYEPRDTTAQAKAGGIFKSYAASDTVSLDAIGGTSASSREVGNYAYSRLVQYNVGVLKPSTGAVEPHLAESWELTDGGSTLVMKLRQDAKFDRRSPTNGKTVSSADVAYSWEKFARVGIQRAELINAANPLTPFPSQVQTPDPRTVVFKLTFPWSPALAMLATGTQFVVMPTESEGQFDPKGEVRGSGVWTIDYKASIGTEYRRNPDWWRKDRPYLDGISAPIVPEYATRLSQFRAGGIWRGVVRQEDIVGTKTDIADLLLTSQTDFPVSTGSVIFFGFQAASPYKDDRIRKAVSMALDRDLFIDITTGADKFKAAGLPTPSAWNSHVSVGWGPYWLDPKAKDFGPNQKYFQHDLGEVKKLISAAGYANGLESLSSVSTINTSNEVPLLLGMLDEAGIKNKREVIDYSTNWLPKLFYGHGDFTGLSINGQYSSPEIGVELLSAYHSKGARTHFPEGTDPALDRLIENQFKEFDEKKRVALVQEIQRHLADKMYMVFGAGASLAYDLSWPWVGNLGVHRLWPGSLYTNATESLIQTWVTDDQKRQAG